MSETSEEKPSPHSIIIKALSELVRAGESPDTERWANVRRDVVCREVIKIRDANDAQRKELASLRSTVAALTAENERLRNMVIEHECHRYGNYTEEFRQAFRVQLDAMFPKESPCQTK